jgi:hypothetical protein
VRPVALGRGLMALLLCVLGSGAPGCSSSKVSCNSVGCGDPITVNATIAGPARGPYDVTFCKGTACETVRVDTSTTEVPDATGTFVLGVGASVTDSGGLDLAVVVRSATDLVDGESLRLTVVDASGARLLDWTEKAQYQRSTPDGPGCGQCTSMVATATR